MIPGDLGQQGQTTGPWLTRPVRHPISTSRGGTPAPWLFGPSQAAGRAASWPCSRVSWRCIDSWACGA